MGQYKILNTHAHLPEQQAAVGVADTQPVVVDIAAGEEDKVVVLGAHKVAAAVGVEHTAEVGAGCKVVVEVAGMFLVVGVEDTQVGS